MSKKAKNVDEYIADAPQWTKATLKKLRKTIRDAAPEAEEKISYRMPYYSQNGRLAYFGYYTDHCSFHWVSDEDKKTFAKDLVDQKVVGSTLQIPRGEKVPTEVIKKIVRSRVKSNENKKGKSKLVNKRG